MVLMNNKYFQIMTSVCQLFFFILLFILGLQPAGIIFNVAILTFGHLFLI